MLLLLLLCRLYSAEHSDVQAGQHCCVHVCKGTSSRFVAPKANRFVFQHSKDGLQVIFSTSCFESLFDTSHDQRTSDVLRTLPTPVSNNFKVKLSSAHCMLRSAIFVYNSLQLMQDTTNDFKS